MGRSLNVPSLEQKILRGCQTGVTTNKELKKEAHEADGADALLRTPLYDLHVELGGRMVPFAGYALPVQYPTGIMTEHQHTRAQAGLFDVSHMGQATLRSTATPATHEQVALAFERVIPGALTKLGLGRMRYSMLLNDRGGVIDDLIVSRLPHAEDAGSLYLVVNGSEKQKDFAHIDARLKDAVTLERLDDRALLALQGPAAESALAELCPDAAKLFFQQIARLQVGGVECIVSRSGYTGEDGFEISVPAPDAAGLAKKLLADERVKPIGLGARDSLRLEAGMCLYGHDLSEDITPVEAALTFAIGKRRKMERDFPGAERVMDQLFDGAARTRVGIRLEGRAPAREGATIVDQNENEIGTVTSGGFGPSVGGPIAMGYVRPDQAADGTGIGVVVRGKTLPATVAPLPFVPHKYKRKQ